MKPTTDLNLLILYRNVAREHDLANRVERPTPGIRVVDLFTGRRALVVDPSNAATQREANAWYDQRPR